MASELPLTPPEDGLLDREAGEWARDKLAIIRCYLPAFGRACRGKVPRWYFVDAFSGPGVNRLRESGERIWGSPMIALDTDPAFTKCLLLDKGKREMETLTARAAPFGGHAVIRQGDANTDLVSLMEPELDKKAPCVCLLDPEGPHLAWETVEAIARFKSGRYKVEQLILLPTHTGFIRELPLLKSIEAWGERDLRRVFGNDDWKPIWERRRRGEIGADQATTEYVRLYAHGLRGLGYKTVLDREIRTRGWGGRILYFLVFATDNDAGKKVMDWCFDNIADAGRPTLPGIKAPRRRRVNP